MSMYQLIKNYGLGLIVISLMGCATREVREIKNSTTGNPAEKYEVVEVNGSFLRDGYYKNWYNNGQLKDEGQYKENKKTGEWKTYYENGQQLLQVNYTEDKPDGKYISWHENGQKNEEGEFSKGQKTGTCTTWYPSGQKKLEEVFSEADEKQTSWYQTGQRKLEGNLKSGIKEGIWNFWAIDGQLIRTYKYENGKDMALVGKWIVKEPYGQHSEEYFPDGTFIVILSNGKEKTNYKFHDEAIKIGEIDFQILRLTETEYEFKRLNFPGEESFKGKRVQ